jgi:hypothetical protein
MKIHTGHLLEHDSIAAVVQSVPMSLKGRYLAFAALSVALARYQAKNPHLSPRSKEAMAVLLNLCNSKFPA